MTRPLLSVVVPVYNHEKFVAAALWSIIHQKWRPMELIVIDDGSRDASAAIAAEVLAAEMPDAIFIARENRGAHNTINQGLAMARGDVLTVLNSDDLFGPERLGRCMSIIAQQGIDFLFTDCGFIDRDGMPILGDPYVDSIRAAANRAELYPSLGFALLKNNLAVSTGNFMFSRRLWQLIGPFRSYRYVHDWDFILRALFHTEPFYSARAALPLSHSRREHLFHPQGAGRLRNHGGDAQLHASPGEPSAGEPARAVAPSVARAVRVVRRQDALRTLHASPLADIGAALMRRALVFAHYDPHGMVDEHVLHLLTTMRQYFEVIHFVSTADLDRAHCGPVLRLVDRVIIRRNVGYDFGSWRTGFEALPRLDWDEVVFANDSCYGPCSDIGEFLARAADTRADLWGASLNRQFRPHVQSYFMGFGRRLLRSGLAHAFWSGVEPIEDKMQLIFAYEVGLSSKVEEAGMRIAGVVDIKALDSKLRQQIIADNHSSTDPARAAAARRFIEAETYLNPMQLGWAESLRQGSPFVKVELLRDNPLMANVSNCYALLKQQRWYDVTLIQRHLARVALAEQLPSLTHTNAATRRPAPPPHLHLHSAPPLPARRVEH